MAGQGREADDLHALPVRGDDGGDDGDAVQCSVLQVRAGGATVFPNLGLVVPPAEGTALFWHTINTKVRTGVRGSDHDGRFVIVQGEMDQRMKHLGCPVVQGDKWIVNK